MRSNVFTSNKEETPNKKWYVEIGNWDSKELTLVEEDNKEYIGAWLSMYLIKYGGYRFTNWVDKEEPSFERLREVLAPLPFERYEFALILYDKEDLDKPTEEMKRIIGKYADYILLEEKGGLNLVSEQEGLESLISDGYKWTIGNNPRDDNYSFGLGIYCFDKDIIEQSEVPFPVVDITRYAKFDKPYLRCIDDVCNADKAGEKIDWQQELVIPFWIDEIEWDI